MRIIEIEACDDCPMCEYFNGWNGHSDVLVCTKLNKIIKNVGDTVDSECPLNKWESIDE